MNESDMFYYEREDQPDTHLFPDGHGASVSRLGRGTSGSKAEGYLFYTGAGRAGYHGETILDIYIPGGRVKPAAEKP